MTIILLVLILISPLFNVFTHIDERFTVNLLKLSFADSFKLIMVDVHPPLYYLIIQFFINLFGVLHISTDIRLIAKIVTLIPYIIILLYSGFKLRKEYGWFSSGLFSFMLLTMSSFYIYSITARMYSWELLFVFFSFIYFKKVLEKQDNKSWLLFVIFNILGLYTQYFIFFIVGILYLFILINIFKKRDKSEFRSNFKNLLKSIVLSVILYIPGLIMLYHQLNVSGHSNGRSFASLEQMLQIISSYSLDLSFVGSIMDKYYLIFEIISILFLLVIIYLSYKKFIGEKNNSSYYVLCGSLLLPITIIISLVVLPLLFGGVNSRYLLPIIGVFWFVVAILLSNLKNKAVFSILLIIVLLFSFSGIYHNFEITKTVYDERLDEESFLNQLNDENNVIVYTHINGYHNYHNDLNNTKEYLTKPFVPYDDDYIVEKNLTKIIEDNEGKNVYILQTTTNGKFKKDQKITAQKVYQLPEMPTYFFKLGIKE